MINIVYAEKSRLPKKPIQYYVIIFTTDNLIIKYDICLKKKLSKAADNVINQTIHPHHSR